ncbi:MULTISPECIES: hypothetical protein [unclassified Acinetobacter]|uniref:hypothetical protein n=1 Tax=unclassified Acinetobacter TaxID=196816 RepID=UPI0029342BBB|nr:MULTISPECIES: hypothetical protein [unclassified Acinetobacter]WOE31881.1 hypothetical protein QSG84_01250 [Acinetobacter sp. SAAs470]WOE37348.1 hypothetical protein QSG86_10295 [Acinetobacter sp. SAAs474]
MSCQVIKLDIQATDDVVCPHCKHRVIDWSNEQYIQPCQHVLFIAMDIGFEYITDEFETTMSRCVDELHEHDDQVVILDELKASTYPDFLILQSDLGVQGYSRYSGFIAKK